MVERDRDSTLSDDREALLLTVLRLIDRDHVSDGGNEGAGEDAATAAELGALPGVAILGPDSPVRRILRIDLGDATYVCLRVPLNAVDGLSEREEEIVQLLAEGELDTTAAAKMGIGMGTYRTFKNRIRRKWGTLNRVDLALRALFFEE